MNNIFPITITFWAFWHFITVFASVYGKEDEQKLLLTPADQKRYRRTGYALLTEYMILMVWSVAHINIDFSTIS